MADYVNNESLSSRVDIWARKVREAKQEGLTPPVMPNDIAEDVMRIARNTIKQSKYSVFSHAWREEMVLEAIYNVVRYLHTFDGSHETNKGKPNAFSFITRSVENVFSDVINRERRQIYFQNKLGVSLLHAHHDNLSSDPDLDGVVDVNGLIDDMATRASQYEKRQHEKREIAKMRSQERKKKKESEAEIQGNKSKSPKTNSLF